MNSRRHNQEYSFVFFISKHIKKFLIHLFKKDKDGKKIKN